MQTDDLPFWGPDCRLFEDREAADNVHVRRMVDRKLAAEQVALHDASRLRSYLT